MDQAELLRELALGHTRVELRCHTWWSPDAGRPIIESPPDFLAVVFGGVLSYLCPSAAFVQELDDATLEALFADARAAVDRGIEGRGGVDTAVGRPWTDLRLLVEAIDGSSRSLRFSFNHYHSKRAYRCDPLWRLLTVVKSRVALDPRAERGAFDVVLERLRPPPDPVWDAGLVVPIEPATRVELAAPFYLRLGQPPADSPLYLVRVDGSSLEVVRIEPDHAVMRIGLGQWWSSPRSDPYRSDPTPEARLRLANERGAVELETAATGRRAYVQRGSR